MNRIFLLLFSWSCLIFLSTTQGQGVDSSVVTSAQYTVIFLPGENYSVNYANRIIRVIAEDVDKNFRDTRIHFAFRMDISFLKNGGEEPSLFVRVKPGKFSGDVHYRGFDLSEVLFPSHLSGNLLFINRKDSVVNFQVKISDKLVTEDFTIPLQGMDDPLHHLADSIQLSDVTFHYDKASFSLFEKRVFLINDYYASSIVTDTLLRYSGLFIPGELANWPLYFIQLEEVAKMLKIMEYRRFDSSLRLSSHDPLALAGKINELRRQSLSMNMTFRENLDRAAVIPPRYTLDSLAHLFVNGMLSYIRWSLYGTWQNGRIYDDFLSGYFTIRGFEEELMVTRNLLGKMYPSENPDSLMKRVTVKIEEAYDVISDRLTEQSQYAEAVALLENRREFVKSNPYSDHQSTNNGAYVKAVNGIYQSYLDVASKAMERGKMKLATTYFEKANTYKRAFQGLIMRDTVEGKVTQQYYTERMSECEQLASSGTFAEALECYTEFAQSLDTISFILLRKELDGRIQRVRIGLTLEYLREVVSYAANEQRDSAMLAFDLAVQLKKSFPPVSRVDSILASLYPMVELLRFRRFMDEATMAVELRQFSHAYTLLQQARLISDAMNYPPEPLLDSLQFVAYPRYIIDQLSLAEYLIWMNRFSVARATADSIESDIDRTGHAENLQLAKALNHFRVKIDQRICWNVKDSFNVLLIRAGKNLEWRKYLRASILLDSAKRLAENWPTCILELSPLNDTLKKYSPLFRFEGLLIRTENSISIGNFADGVTAYKEASDLYQSNKLVRFGIEQLTLYQYIALKSNLALAKYMVGLSLEQKDVNEAFSYLQLMASQKCSPQEAKDLADTVAKESANRDYRIDSTQDPIILCRKYTEGDDWFANFERSYLNEWKRLKKETVKPTKP